MLLLKFRAFWQGYSLDQLTQGVSTLVNLADEVDERIHPGRIRIIDIGGGLPREFLLLHSLARYE